jgi:HD-like signal output (HDOD) protein
MPSGNPGNLKELLAGAQLPALPQSAIKLLELSQDPNNGAPEFAKPIEADPGLTGQVLRFVNSSYFGFSREISSIKLAITLVGVRTIKNFSLWSAVFSLMPNPKCGPFDMRSLWQDSLRRGLFARSIGKIQGMKDAEDLFAASLLQDMAIPLLAKELAKQYVAMLSQRQEGKVRLSELERKDFGWDHAEAAGQMARGWNLPEEFARLIESHLKIDEHLSAPTLDKGAASVSLSALLPTHCDAQWHEREKFIAAYEKLAAGTGKAIGEVFQKVDAEYAEIAPMLKLPSSKVTLEQALAAQAVPA